MTFLDYLNELIPLDSMVPEFQCVIAGALVIVCVRLVAGAILNWFERMFNNG